MSKVLFQIYGSMKICQYFIDDDNNNINNGHSNNGNNNKIENMLLTFAT